MALQLNRQMSQKEETVFTVNQMQVCQNPNELPFNSLKNQPLLSKPQRNQLLAMLDRKLNTFPTFLH